MNRSQKEHDERIHKYSVERMEREAEIRELESQRDEAGRRYVQAVGDLHEAQRKIAEMQAYVDKQHEDYRIQVNEIVHLQDKVAELEAELAATEADHNLALEVCSVRADNARLREALKNSWRLIPEPKDGDLVVYVGVHAVDWRPEFGKPTVAFAQNDEAAKELKGE